MSKPQHTIGYWYVEPTFGGVSRHEYEVRAKKDGENTYSKICTIEGWHDNPFEARADALLIAAAPEMLEMLKYLAGDQYDSGRQKEIEALIAKAEGRNQR